MSKALEIVTDFRNKAIVVLRLSKINTLTEDLQVFKSNLKSTTTELENVNKHITEVSSGEFSPSYADMEQYGTAEEARNSVLKQLNTVVEALTKQLEKDTKIVVDTTTKINEVASGKVPFSRDTITNITANIILTQAMSLPTLEEIAVVDEGTNEDVDVTF